MTCPIGNRSSDGLMMLTRYASWAPRGDRVRRSDEVLFIGCGAQAVAITEGAVSPPPSNPRGINELVITAGGVVAIPAASSDHPDYVVILNNTAPVAVFGGPNNTIWGGGAQITIIDPATIAAVETAGDATVALAAAARWTTPRSLRAVLS
jgi:hypothetical protein